MSVEKFFATYGSEFPQGERREPEESEGEANDSGSERAIAGAKEIQEANFRRVKRSESDGDKVR